MSATNTAFGFAALSSQLNVNSEASDVVGEDGYIQALPDGHFAPSMVAPMMCLVANG